MSQPFDRGATLSAPGEIDPDTGEFWSANPWSIAREHNLSFFERNRTFLNVGGEDYVDVSYVSGMDTDGDSRSVVAADLNHDGRLELVVRQVGGGPLLVYENRFPDRHYLMVSLRGTESNRLGIGARLTAEVEGRTLVRELYPINSFRSQGPACVHFGLADAQRVDRLTVRWPSGRIQQIEAIEADRHVVVTEGSDTLQIVRPGRRVLP